MPNTTHPVRQKATAVATAQGKKKPAAKSLTPKPAPKKAPSRWKDTAGVDLVKGLRVRAGGSGDKIIGTVAYRHTHSIDGKPVGMIGVALSEKGATAKVGGRTVKNRSFRADELDGRPRVEPQHRERPRGRLQCDGDQSGSLGAPGFREPSRPPAASAAPSWWSIRIPASGRGLQARF